MRLVSEMRVLLVAGANDMAGGGEKHVADVIDGLMQRGIAVGLVFPGGGSLGAHATGVGVEQFPAALAAGFSFARVAGVRRAIDAFAPDIVHAHGSRAALFARLADPRASARCVYTVHGIHVDKAGSAARRTVFLAVERSMRARTARFVTVCESDIEKGSRLGVLDAQRASVVYNGISAPADVPARGAFRAQFDVPAGAPLVLSVGRFHQQKDQATLLRAWRSVIAQRPDAVLALVGSGELEGRLREIAVAQELGASIRFVAPRPSLAEAYADADAFALASLWEGLPYVVLEAMSFGVPVVATAVDGVPEAVIDGETGLLVAAGDALALGRSLAGLLGDDAARRRMGDAGRLRVAEQFTLDGMIDGLLGVYAGVMK